MFVLPFKFTRPRERRWGTRDGGAHRVAPRRLAVGLGELDVEGYELRLGARVVHKQRVPLARLGEEARRLSCDVGFGDGDVAQAQRHLAPASRQGLDIDHALQDRRRQDGSRQFDGTNHLVLGPDADPFEFR